MKVTENLAQHFVFGTYYITLPPKVRIINKNNRLKIIVKPGERPCELDTKNIHVTIRSNEIILNPFSKSSCNLLVNFAKYLNERYSTNLTFQYSGIHVNSIQNIRKESLFKTKRSGEYIDENDIITPHADKFYNTLLEKEIIEHKGTKYGKVILNFEEKNIILKTQKRNGVIVLVPGTK